MNNSDFDRSRNQNSAARQLVFWNSDCIATIPKRQDISLITPIDDK
jgi:hypothetical protein